MTEAEQYVFYTGKRHMYHMAINIALAPVLLYIVQLWAWPPTLPHYITFAITSVPALKYVHRQKTTPRLAIDETGVHFGRFYPAENIYRAEPSFRGATLTLLAEGKLQSKVVNLGWASGEDCKIIQQLLTERFQRELPTPKP